jgi:oligoribonuclease
MADRKHEFIWLDLETTGLLGTEPGDLHGGGVILEWAIIFAADDREGDMAPVQEYTGVVHHDTLPAMNHFCACMHTQSGLLAEVARKPCARVAQASTTADTDAFLHALMVDATGNGSPSGLTLAGNSVHFDLAWIRVHLPRFASCLSHRVFDVSTLKRAAKSWGADFAYPSASKHRALADARASLAAAAAWRKATYGR